MLTNHKTPTQPGGRKRPIVSVYNSDKRLVEALQLRTGYGRIYRHKRQPREHQKRDTYSWRLTAIEQRLVLPLVMPWLVSKREQAELLLEALAIKDELTVSKGAQMPRSRQIALITRRDNLQARISFLNRRGRLTAEEVMPK